MSVHDDDMIAVIGYTSSDDLPTYRAIQGEYGGYSDTMVWVFGFEEPQPITNGPPFISIGVLVIGVVALVLIIGLRRRT
jgi:hypothetical protein